MKLNFGKGFTLIELLVVLAIVTILTVIATAYYHSGQGQYALQRSVHKLAQDIRRAQAMTMAGEEYQCKCQPQWALEGYGITLSKSEKTYSLKARCETSTDEYCDDSIEEMRLEAKVLVDDLWLTLLPEGSLISSTSSTSSL